MEEVAMYTKENFVEDLRAMRKKNIHGMKTNGNAGVSPHLIHREVRDRVEIEGLVSLTEALRHNGIIMILGREGFCSGRGSLRVIESTLDENFFTGEGNWKSFSGADEYNSVRIYIISDGLPETIARQNVVKRALYRMSRG